MKRSYKEIVANDQINSAADYLHENSLSPEEQLLLALRLLEESIRYIISLNGGKKHCERQKLEALIPACIDPSDNKPSYELTLSAALSLKETLKEGSWRPGFSLGGMTKELYQDAIRLMELANEFATLSSQPVTEPEKPKQSCCTIM